MIHSYHHNFIKKLYSSFRLPLKPIFLCLLFFSFTIIGFSQEKVSVFRINTIPDNATINDIVIHNDIVFVASSAGLYQLNPTNLESVQIKSDPCDGLCISASNTIFASFEKRYIENITTGEKFNYETPDLEINDLEYSRGKVWVASSNGILTLSKRTNSITSEYNTRNSKLKSNNIGFIHIDKQENMWAGTDAGVILINNKDKWKVYETHLSMEAMHFNHEGLWLVSNKEMWLVDPFNRWYPAAIDKGLKEGKIRDITADSTGRLYMASDILVRYDPYTEEIESFKETPALVSKQCSSVASDRDNRIWLGTVNSGLFLIGFKNEAKQKSLSAFCLIEENIKCPGGRAKVKLIVEGGQQPYDISWSDGVSGSKNRDLVSGSYDIIVKDATGRTSRSGIRIEDLPSMRFAVLETKPESQPGRKDAKAKVIITGGQAPYKIVWPNQEKGTEALQLPSGTHEVIVSDANDCTITGIVDIITDRLLPDLELGKITVGQTLQINNLFFTADSTEVIETSFQVLDEIYAFLSKNPSVIIEIGGHTNNIPTHEYCDRLSNDRAKNVAYYLYKKGIEKERISFKGYGKRNPIASNSTLEGRNKNQRVEIKIINIAG